MAALEQELATYHAKLPELLKEAGKFVVIKDDRVEGVREAYSDALKLAYERDLDGGFLVKRIASTQQLANFTRDLAGICRV